MCSESNMEAQEDSLSCKVRKLDEERNVYFVYEKETVTFMIRKESEKKYSKRKFLN